MGSGIKFSFSCQKASIQPFGCLLSSLAPSLCLPLLHWHSHMNLLSSQPILTSLSLQSYISLEVTTKHHSYPQYLIFCSLPCNNMAQPKVSSTDQASGFWAPLSTLTYPFISHESRFFLWFHSFLYYFIRTPRLILSSLIPQPPPQWASLYQSLLWPASWWIPRYFLTKLPITLKPSSTSTPHLVTFIHLP